MACQKPLSYSVHSSSPTHSNATTMAGTKWRKKLTRLSKKLQSGSRQEMPMTAAAAATEKLLRRPKATVQTEDLTASQFASMAGIKIQRGRYHQETDEPSMTFDDDDDDDYSDEDSDTTEMLPFQQLTVKATKTHQGSLPCVTSLSSSRSIWDARFWQQQQQPKQQKDKSDVMYSDLSTNDSLSSAASTLDTCLYTPSSKPRVLHKGRFQIVMGDTPTSEPLIRTGSSESSNNVVEWHRKRAMTQ
ncbi:hypothetical protein BC941DRAFT_430598 [Chlamydoabsidia padenii]|nr:hypothetical protein BC941DRAFT_430598 [Chlamydoabsidia padenii]